MHSGKSEFILTLPRRVGMKGCRPLTEAEVALVRRSFGGRYARRVA
jgi:hypothetical protein